MKSRKFWFAVFGCAVCMVMMHLTFDSFDPALAVTCLALFAMIAAAYLIAQGWEDRARAVSRLTISNTGGDVYAQEK